jgi:hypothetical protein
MHRAGLAVAVHVLHDPLRPFHSIRNQALYAWPGLRVAELLNRLEIMGHNDRGGDYHHSFVRVVH